MHVALHPRRASSSAHEATTFTLKCSSWLPEYDELRSFVGSCENEIENRSFRLPWRSQSECKVNGANYPTFPSYTLRICVFVIPSGTDFRKLKSRLLSREGHLWTTCARGASGRVAVRGETSRF